MKIYISFFIFILVIISCGPKPKVVEPTPLPPIEIGKGNCPLDQPNWNTIEVGMTSDQKVELLTELLSSFKADNENTKTEDILNAEGELTAEFTNSFNQTIQSMDSRTYKISDDLQDLIVAGRALGCDIHAGLYTGDNRSAAEQKLLLLRTEILNLKKNIEQN